MIKGAARLEGRAPMSGFEALRPWRYAKVRPIAAALRAAAQQLAQLRYRGRGGGVSAPARASLPTRPVSMTGVCTAAILLLAVPLFTLEADARGGFGGHGGGFGGHGGFAGRGGMGFGGARSFSVARFGGARIAGRAFAGRSFAARSLASPRVATARFAGTGGRFTVASAHTLAGIRGAHWGGRGVFGNRAIGNVAWRSQFASARFHGRFFGSRWWPWWWGGLVI